MPTAGVTVVGVLPTHRRRGILRELMRAQLDDIHDRGEPLAALWASEGSIYGRFGYGLSSLCGDMEIQRTDTAFVRPVDWGGTSTLVDKDAALRLFPPVYDRVQAATPGMFSRSRDWWEHARLQRLGMAPGRRRRAFVRGARARGAAAGVRDLPAQLLLRGRGPDREDGGDRSDGLRSGCDRRRLALPLRHRLDGGDRGGHAPARPSALPAPVRSQPDEVPRRRRPLASPRGRGRRPGRRGRTPPRTSSSSASRTRSAPGTRAASRSTGRRRDPSPICASPRRRSGRPFSAGSPSRSCSARARSRRSRRARSRGRTPSSAPTRSPGARRSSDFC